MPELMIDLLIVLSAGLLAGAVCRLFGASMLVGYLIAGGLIGDGGLQLVSHQHHQMEQLARAGALLLLFSIGIELSIDRLTRLGRSVFLGGSLQMLLVIVPVAMVLLIWNDWRPALMIAAATGLSSTVLVFRALAEWGQTRTRHGQRAIAVLLFQDLALIPLMLLVPLLREPHAAFPVRDALVLAATSVLFAGGVLGAQRIVPIAVVPLLAKIRSRELTMLFALTVLIGGCLLAWEVGLPPALGAFAAGLVLSGTRMSAQVDVLVLPFRETFAAVFFVSLGTMLQPATFIEGPWLFLGGFVGVLLVKSLAASVALRASGLSWPSALGTGIGLAQLGEFSFVLFVEALGHGLISQQAYDRMLLIALGTLILTPQLVRFGLRWSPEDASADTHAERRSLHIAGAGVRHGLVIGAGLVGRHVASQLETLGFDLCLVDLSPVNLYEFASQGFRTVTGDASDEEVLRRTGVGDFDVCVVSVPDDIQALRITRLVRRFNPQARIVVRCRYLSNRTRLLQAGAVFVVSEEEEAARTISLVLENIRPPVSGRHASQ